MDDSIEMEGPRSALASHIADPGVSQHASFEDHGFGNHAHRSWVVPAWAQGNDWSSLPLAWDPEPGEETNDV